MSKKNKGVRYKILDGSGRILVVKNNTLSEWGTLMGRVEHTGDLSDIHTSMLEKLEEMEQ